MLWQCYQIKGIGAAAIYQHLPPALFKQLCTIQTDLAYQIALSFQKNTIYILIASPFDFWTANIGTCLTSDSHLQQLAWILKAVTETLEPIAAVTTLQTTTNL